MCAADCLGHRIVQIVHQRAAGEQAIGSSGDIGGQRAMFRWARITEFQHVAEHGDAAPAGCRRSTASAARIEAGLPL